jgi:hypothetical protein
MFDSLADQIKHDNRETTNNTQRVLQWAGIAVISVLVFGGLYFAVRLAG